jgi:plastocyanin
MRRFIALLLVTPLLASCSDSVTPVAPSDAALALEESPLEQSPLTEWTLEEWTLGQQAALEQSPLQGAPASGEVMAFGNPDAGTDYPPQVHDESLHGKDRVIPGTVVIDAGQTVTFQVYPGHRVAIYNQGVRPEDITVPPTGSFVLDPTNRLYLQPSPTPTVTRTFPTPGRYLVICAARRHFVVARMWGWVIVR